ncbi:MAG: hypothetical protein ACREPQ_14090 [Rhodanobacter sp.]
MADGLQDIKGRTLYVVSCDQRARGPDGTIMVAGTEFSAPNSYPGLTWGVGAPSYVTAEAPRWLVIDTTDLDRHEGGVRIRSGKILCDGTLQDVADFLDRHGGSQRPHIAKKRAVGDWGVGALGMLSDLTASAYATAAIGNHSRATLADNCRVATGYRARLKGGDQSTLALGDQTSCKVGHDAVIAAGEFVETQAGDRAVVASTKSGRASVGAGGVVVGSYASLFRGGEGAIFVARAIDPEGTPTVAVGRVSPGGLKADQWYRVEAGSFVEVADDDAKTFAGAHK